MIKVCHIADHLTGKADGVFNHLKMIFKNYDRSRFEHIIIFQGGDTVEQKLSDIEIRFYVVESLKKKISFNSFKEIYKIIKKENPDILHTHLIKPYAIAGIVNIFFQKKFIFNYHGIFLKNNPYYNFLERSIYSAIHLLIHLFGKVDVVLVPSKRSKQLLMEETNLFPEPIVYYNGYNSKQNFPVMNTNIVQRIEMLKKNKKIIAVVGRLEIDKRIDLALMIVKSLVAKQKNIHLLVFGDGRLKNELNQVVQRNELNNSVDFFGYVEEVESYYKYFDLVLFTSDWEGMPLTMWEALANEIPVVAPDVGGFREILEENNCGLNYEQGNLKEAETKMLQMINDESLRLKLGRNGRLAIEKKYNEKEFIHRIEKVYSDLVSQC